MTKYTQVNYEAFVPEGYADSGWDNDRLFIVPATDDLDLMVDLLEKHCRSCNDIEKWRFISHSQTDKTPHCLDCIYDHDGKWVDER